MSDLSQFRKPGVCTRILNSPEADPFLSGHEHLEKYEIRKMAKIKKMNRHV